MFVISSVVAFIALYWADVLSSFTGNKCDEDFRPCRCINDTEGRRVVCSGEPVEEIQKAFRQPIAPLIDTAILNLPDSINPVHLPDNLLGNKRAKVIEIAPFEGGGGSGLVRGIRTKP